ncbi:MAG: succinate dehydrogenase, hydrophobic membrane anchor protein [Chloroflexi bacterium]|nr:succinate dehydrogenase, hydrophobic membrane anchor protein [Chloroflexota bacterium]
MATTRNRPQGGSNFELWSWYYFRISGVLLLFFALIHLFVMHMVDRGVDRVDFNFVADRWANPMWRIFDFLLLALALTHGMNGLRVIVDDYVHRRGWRVFAQSTLFVVSVLVLVVGSLVVFTFQSPIPTR